MVKGTTSSGFKFEIDEKALDDMRFVDALAETEENALAFSKVLTMALGKAQKDRLYDHIADKSGRVPTDKATEEFTEILELAGKDVKNSEPSPA